jgi:hypothetical protein
MTRFPDWWNWELEISSHCLKRMSDRGFTETDVRVMIADAESVELQDHGTYIVATRLGRAGWEVIVTPDANQQVLIVVTAYAVS